MTTALCAEDKGVWLRPLNLPKKKRQTVPTALSGTFFLFLHNLVQFLRLRPEASILRLAAGSSQHRFWSNSCGQLLEVSNRLNESPMLSTGRSAR